MRKRLFYYMTGVTLAGLFLTSCGKVNTTINVNINGEKGDEEQTKMVNPLVDIDSDAEYENQLGIKWDTSYLPGEVKRFIINGKIAQAVFEVESVDGDNVEITLRGTKDEELSHDPVTMIAGIYATELEDVNSIDISTNDGVIIFNRTRDDADDYDISYFDYEGVHYTITDDGDLSQMELGEIYDSVMATIGAVQINEPERTGTGNIIRPLKNNLSLDNLEGSYSCRIGSIDVDEEGNVTGDFDIYMMDLYDTVDMNTIQPGDIIIVNEEEILVESVEDGEPVDMSYENPETLGLQSVVVINGGLDFGGLEFIAHEGGTYRFFGFDDMATYSYEGEITVPVAEDAVITDHAHDLDGEEPNPDGTSIKASDFKEYFENELEEMSGDNYFYERNTSIRIENGRVYEITRAYTP